MIPASLPHLLLVDDDPLIVDTLSIVLGQSFVVHAAGSRNEAGKTISAPNQGAIAMAASIDNSGQPSAKRQSDLIVNSASLHPHMFAEHAHL